MQRFKNTGSPSQRRPTGPWLAGMMIDIAIMTVATQAIMLGASAAIQDAT